MITLITGVVGSGKTVYCIQELLKFKLGTTSYKNHKNILTNIAGFDTSYFLDTEYDYYDLNFTKFYAHLKEMHNLYLKYEDLEDNTDDILIAYAKENKIYDSFIVIDEAHNFFDNQDKVKIWFLTYHRHLHQNIFLITQNKMLINTKYRQLPELFIKALPGTKKITKDFRYNTYGEFNMKDKISTVVIENRPELFEMYTSGNYTKQKSYSLKPLIVFGSSIFLVLSLVITLFFVMTPDNLTTEKKEVDKKSVPVSSPVPVKKPQAIKSSFIDKDNFVIKVYFLNTLGFQVNGKFYNIEHFSQFVKNTNSKILSQKELYRDKGRLLKEYYIQTKQDYLNNYFVYEKITPDPIPLEQDKKISNPFASLSF